MKADTGAWTRARIARDRAREAGNGSRRAIDGGDPFPAGLTPERLGGEREPDDWDAFEPNTYGGD